ncbi:hypothetical protein V1522DRAFT_415860 [Lipomyces starkeyi]
MNKAGFAPSTYPCCIFVSQSPTRQQDQHITSWTPFIHGYPWIWISADNAYMVYLDMHTYTDIDILPGYGYGYG